MLKFEFIKIDTSQTHLRLDSNLMFLIKKTMKTSNTVSFSRKNQIIRSFKISEQELKAVHLEN